MKSELPGAGKGLFTTKPIPKGSVIAKYTGDVVVEMDPDYGNPYALRIKDQPPTFLDASRTNTAEGRWVNDARNEGAENAELHYDKQKKQGYLEATRDIEAGEEIYTDYGPDYWENKATIPDLKGRRAMLSSREKRADAVKVVEELQDDDGYAPEPEPVAPPRVRKHIAEPEPQYEEPAPKPAPKPRAAQKNARILPPRAKAPPNTQYRKGLIARLRMMQMMLASEKFVKELGLEPTKKSFAIPDAEMNTEGLKELEAVEKAALKQLLAHFNTGKAKLTQEKLVALVDALVKKHGVAKLQGAGFNPNRSIFDQF